MFNTVHNKINYSTPKQNEIVNKSSQFDGRILQWISCKQVYGIQSSWPDIFCLSCLFMITERKEYESKTEEGK